MSAIRAEMPGVSIALASIVTRGISFTTIVVQVNATSEVKKKTSIAGCVALLIQTQSNLAKRTQ